MRLGLPLWSCGSWLVSSFNILNSGPMNSWLPPVGTRSRAYLFAFHIHQHLHFDPSASPKHDIVLVTQRSLDDLIYEHERHARARLLRIQAKGREARAALSAATGVAQIERLTLQRAATDRLLKRCARRGEEDMSRRLIKCSVSFNTKHLDSKLGRYGVVSCFFFAFFECSRIFHPCSASQAALARSSAALTTDREIGLLRSAGRRAAGRARR